jgi:hypothetical protein
VKSLDGRHYFSFLGDLDAISDEEEPTVDARDIGEDFEHGPRPNQGQFIQPKACSMEKVEYPVITKWLKPHGTDDAGNPQEIDSHGHSGKAGDKPEEGSRSPCQKGVDCLE